MKRYDYENEQRIQLHATEIDASEFDRLFDAWEGGRKAPHGIWYIDEGECWAGIDNYDGDFWVEPFGLLADCIDWLEDDSKPAWEYESYNKTKKEVM